MSEISVEGKQRRFYHVGEMREEVRLHERETQAEKREIPKEWSDES